jgi:uncharacterized membrane protein YsdA (DUF1294 family)
MPVKIFTIYLIIINIMAFGIYGIDKFKAMNNQWRIPESTLITYAFIGGGIGCLCGMRFFHHKTRKIKFRLLVPMGIIIDILAFIYYLS